MRFTSSIIIRLPNYNTVKPRIYKKLEFKNLLG
jgi:hypothetical protein